MSEKFKKNNEEQEMKKKVEKILYKNQKRKTRNRLIYLVGFHVFLIFCFIGLISYEYLMEHDWSSYRYLSLVSDILYACYSLETLFSIKFKNRNLLITSIVTLAIAFGMKVIVFVNSLRDG